ncbi:MAG: PEGA domain-containing protein, partial [Planctomycetota bacterium]
VEHALGNVIEARQRSTFVSTDEDGQEMAFSSEFATVNRRSAVAAGSYRLVVEVDGREPVTKEFEVRAGETTTVSIDLGED